MSDPDGQFYDCPDCGLPVEVLLRCELESTDGPIEHVRVTCVSGRHAFFMPREMLERGPEGFDR